MTTVTIFGAGAMGQAISEVLRKGGSQVQVIGNGDDAAIEGDIVVLAVPYGALDAIADERSAQLAGRVVVDITNPLDFSTFDSLVTPADSSAAAQLAAKLPQSRVVKAFNTNFAATLTSGTVGDSQQTTTVAVAGDDDSAKQQLISIVEASGLLAVDAGALKRARELEAVGFLALTLAAKGIIDWTGGFAFVK